MKKLDERDALGFKPTLAPYDGHAGDAGPEGDTWTDGGTGARKSKRNKDSSKLPLKHKQDTATAKAFVDATNKVLADGASAQRDERPVNHLFAETVISRGLVDEHFFILALLSSFVLFVTNIRHAPEAVHSRGPVEGAQFHQHCVRHCGSRFARYCQLCSYLRTV